MAQAAAAPPAPRACATRRPASEEGVRWQALTPAQREALAPLERDWPGIDAPRKQKWIALAGRFKTLSPEERARISARMVEWAKLTPAERGQARLRFEEARQLPVPDRSERWRAYQALPPEQRQQLAARAATARERAARRRIEAGRGAGATARRPSSTSSRIRRWPSRRARSRRRWSRPRPGATTTRDHAPPDAAARTSRSGMPKIATTPEFVNRSTLLPKRGPQAAAVASASAPTPRRRSAPRRHAPAGRAGPGRARRSPR